ncbi:MAG TPA: LON peptidase substrate-binding domain-containing protein [Acidimicrobiales bacterium]|nr:LON peptidase substrate-binding domain-containing protein [Acidimicrobiales bacterium]
MTKRLGMFPLSTVLFPGGQLPLQVFEPRYLALTADCLGQDREFGVVMITRGSEVGGGDQRVDTGTVVRIDRGSQLPGNRLFLEVRGVRRIRVDEWLPDDPYPQAMVEAIADAPFAPADGQVLASAETAVRRLRSLLSEMGDVPAIPHDLDLGDRAEEVAWRLCALAPLNLMDRQRLLETDEPKLRMETLTELCQAMASDVTSLLSAGSSGDVAGGPGGDGLDENGSA